MHSKNISSTFLKVVTVGSVLALVGIGLTIYGVVKKETPKSPPPP